MEAQVLPRPRPAVGEVKTPVRFSPRPVGPLQSPREDPALPSRKPGPGCGLCQPRRELLALSAAGGTGARSLLGLLVLWRSRPCVWSRSSLSITHLGLDSCKTALWWSRHDL